MLPGTHTLAMHRAKKILPPRMNTLGETQNIYKKKCCIENKSSEERAPEEW